MGMVKLLHLFKSLIIVSPPLNPWPGFDTICSSQQFWRSKGQIWANRAQPPQENPLLVVNLILDNFVDWPIVIKLVQ